MWCRVLLVAIALTCTFQSEIIAEPDDVICVLLLSGLQKEDFDESLLKKLRKHNVNIDDINHETLEKCIQAVNSEIRKENISFPGKVVQTTNNRHKQTTTVHLHKLIYNFTETVDISNHNKSHSTETDYNTNKCKHKHIGMSSMKNLLKLLDKFKLKCEDEITEKPTIEVNAPITEKVITLNEEKQTDSQDKYFDFINKMFKNYVTVDQTHTTTLKPKNIAVIENNKNIQTTPKNFTVENVISLWKMLDNIKTGEEDDSIDIKIDKIMKQNPVIFYNEPAQKGDSESKGMQYANPSLKSYATAQKAHTATPKSTTAQLTDTIPSRSKEYLEYSKKYHNKDLIQHKVVSIENVNDNWHTRPNIDDKLSPAHNSDISKYIYQLLRRHEPLNASYVLESTSQDTQNINNSKADEYIKTQDKPNNNTIKKELKLIPDEVIKEITENLKTSLLKELQSQMSTTTMKTITENIKDTTTYISPIIIEDNIRNETIDYKTLMEILQKFTKEIDSKYTTKKTTTTTIRALPKLVKDTTTYNKPITIEDNNRNETIDYETLVEILQKFTKGKENKFTTKISSTTTIRALPKPVQEITTFNTPTIISNNQNETTVLKTLLELFQILKKENDGKATTDMVLNSQYSLTDQEKIKLAPQYLHSFMELFEPFKSINESMTIPSDSMYSLTQKKNTKNEFHGPINVLYPYLLPMNYAHDVKTQAITVMPILLNPYQVFQLSTAEGQPSSAHKDKGNKKSQVSVINGFKLNPVNNIESVIEDMPTILSAPVIQTNADTIPPLGIPLSRTVKVLNQNIIVTTKHPMIKYKNEQQIQSDTNGEKYHDYLGRDYDRSDLARSDADIKRTHRAELGRSDVVGHSYTQQTRSIPSDIKRIDRGHIRHRQPSDFVNFYKEYINNIKPHVRDYHPMFPHHQKRERFHEKLERGDQMPRHFLHANIPRDNTRLKVASRQQMSLNELKKRARNSDSYIRNFIKTQQKVNDMLEKILVGNFTDKVRSMETPETVTL